MVQSIANHWTQDYLIDAIKQNYYKRHGALANNFDVALPQPEAEEVKSMLKDPYLFDMLTFKDKFDERVGTCQRSRKILTRNGNRLCVHGQTVPFGS